MRRARQQKMEDGQKIYLALVARIKHQRECAPKRYAAKPPCRRHAPWSELNPDLHMWIHNCEVKRARVIMGFCKRVSRLLEIQHSRALLKRDSRSRVCGFPKVDNFKIASVRRRQYDLRAGASVRYRPDHPSDILAEKHRFEWGSIIPADR